MKILYNIYLKFPDRTDFLFKIYRENECINKVWETDSIDELRNKLEQLSEQYPRELIFPVINVDWQNSIDVLSSGGDCNPIIVSREQPTLLEGGRWYQVLNEVREG